MNIILFDKDERRYFIEKYYNHKILEVYDSIIPGGFKADLWRYCILYQFGGIYCDIDMICLNCFDVLIKDDMDIFMPIDLNTNPSEGKHNLFNAFIGVIPKHPIMKYCIDYIVDNVKNDTWWNGDKLPLEFSGPGVFGKAVNKFLNRPERESFLNLEEIFKIRI